jgi:hypothetical protein
VLLDEVVAVVEAQSITLSEVAAEARIQLVVSRGPDLADAELDRPLLAATLRRLVDERVVLAELERLKLFELDRTELEREQAKLRGRFPSTEAWSAFLLLVEMTEDEVTAVLGRGLRVARYLDNRLRLASQPRESELEEAARSRGALGSAQGLLRAQREELRRELQAEKLQRLLSELLSDLRRRSNVRVLDPLGGGRE